VISAIAAGKAVGVLGQKVDDLRCPRTADGSDLVTVRYERLTRGVTMPPHDALLAPALTEVGSR
jgi:hypothetical protein